MSIEVDVVRVFTDPDGRHGNPLAIVDAASVAPPGRQQLAADLGYSETVFVDLPEPGETVATAQIFTPTTELPFAGHPTVGLSWWLRRRGLPVDTLEVPAGPVTTRVENAITWVRAKADWAPDFTLHAAPDSTAVQGARAAAFDSGHHYLWAWAGEGAIRSRMFAPGLGVPEDEATGAAAVRITDHLRRNLHITQGRGSHLLTHYSPDGWIEVGGRVYPQETRQV
ncbi:PhzF family phenazine biosynthesis protein [Rhodococcus spelaei]|uniref:PhzF family phenazine biosynthesis protein n=1 Tax=Rhodococcus spelaei TaxID=2546320 RepID=A0A541B1Q0_9NOCA|nr:PhzF family phenazine biosynthesis protein [Rhodococcus spelaei]TQF66253.1 PhzF family phenazine biosynthesis protein [Rhodococcus spelaei]